MLEGLGEAPGLVSSGVHEAARWRLPTIQVHLWPLPSPYCALAPRLWRQTRPCLVTLRSVSSVVSL